MNKQQIFDITDVVNIDLEVIAHLQDGEEKYLIETLARLKDCDDNQIWKIFFKYHDMYLTECDLFEENLENYINNIMVIPNYWKLISKNHPNIKFVFDTFIDNISDLGFTDLCNLGLNLPSHLLSDVNFYSVDETFEKTNYFGALLEKADFNMFKIDEVCEVFMNVVSDDSNKNHFINMCAKIFNGAIGRENPVTSCPDYDPSEKMLAILSCVVCKLFTDICTEEDRKTINMDYIISKKCPIRWETKKVDNDDYSLMTQLFFLSLQGIRVYYVPANALIKQYKSEIKYLRKEKKFMEKSIFGKPLAEKIQKQIDEVKKDLEKATYFFTSHLVDYIFHDFYLTVTKIMITDDKKNTHVNNDILSHMATFFANSQTTCYTNNHKFTKLMTRVIGTKKYTTSVHTRSNMLSVINAHDMKHHWDVKEFRMKIFVSLLNLYHDINKNDSLAYQLDIIKVFTTLINTTYGEQSFRKILKNKKFKKMILFILLDITEKMDVFDKSIKMIKRKSRYIRGMAIANKEYDIIGSCLYIINYYLDFFVALSGVKYKDEVLDIIMSAELGNNFALKLNKIMRFISFEGTFKYVPLKDKEHEAKYTHKMYTKGIQTYKLATKIVKILLNFFSIDLQNQISNLEEVELDDYASVTVCEGITDYLKRNNCDMSKYARVLDQLVTSVKNEQSIETEIPYEFCDPIMATPIKKPIVVPDTLTIFDHTVLARLLLQKEEHPITRNKLTMKILDDFNKEDKAVKIIKEFNERLSSWKKKTNKLTK